MAESTVLRAAAYVRVSTLEQNTEIQRIAIEQYAKARKWDLVATYEDKSTGTNDKRPALRKLMDAARAREIDVIIVWKIDRFARSLKNLVTSLQELTELGVQFVAIRDQVDLTTSAGRLMTHMIAAFAQFEAEIIKERVLAGIKNARDHGKRLGRPPVIDTFRVLEMRRHGMSLAVIAKALGVTKGAISKVVSKSVAKLALNNQLPNSEIIDYDASDQKVE